MTVNDNDRLSLFTHAGAVCFPNAITAQQAAFDSILTQWPGKAAAHRFPDLRPLAPIVADSACAAIAQDLIGQSARAVLFDKTKRANWSLAWHRDRTVAVAARKNVAGFDNWTLKRGVHHVEPPFDLLVEMATLWIHLDDVGPDNGPLDSAPGSHRLGLGPEHAIAQAVRDCGVHTCEARAGDV